LALLYGVDLSFETSVTKNQLTIHNITDERRPSPYRS